jgi:multiple sugar transport system substrate-binding protein
MTPRATLAGGRTAPGPERRPRPRRRPHGTLGRTAAIVLLLAVLPGCAARDGTTAEDTMLRVMLPPSEKRFWEPIASAFEAGHPGVRVVLIEGPQSTDLRENLYTASLLARDPTFDLVYMDVTWTAKFAAAGWLRPLDAWSARGMRDAFLPSAWEAGEYRGRLYRVPVRTDVGLLYYRRDLLEQAGIAPPRTFDELVRAARTLQDPPRRWGYVWQGRQYEGLVCDFLEVLTGFGGFWVDPASREVGLDRPEAIEALAFLAASVREARISPPGVTTYQEEESRRLLQDGRAVFLRNWPYAWRLAQAEDSPMRGKLGVLPMVHAAGGRSSGTLGGWGLGISAYSRAPALAADFIRTATSLESQRALCAPTGYAPARREAYDDPELLAANPFLQDLLALHENAVLRPALPRYALASDILQRHLSAVLAGTAEAAVALRQAARETRAMLTATSATAGTPSRDLAPVAEAGGTR